MEIKTDAIVLRSIKFGDSKMIVDLFTEALGRLSFIIRIPKTAKGKLKKQYFQPLTLLNVEFDYRQKLQLQHLRNAEIAYPFSGIPFSAVKLSISLFIAEFLLYVTRDEQTNPTMYKYIANSVEWLDASQRGVANFHLVFMMRLSRFLGFYPNMDEHAATDYFDLRNGCFTPLMPSHDEYLMPQEAEKISLLMRMNFETMHLFQLSKADRNRITQLVIMFYQLHVPLFKDMKSLPVLQQLF
jgi:DNA repair protein RecO (recombination protein O)